MHADKIGKLKIARTFECDVSVVQRVLKAATT